ncbi:MAG: helix-turn-helix transcriptional regulator, partial [Chromatiales bacterium]|nr:helix-turn-helix transcriptional regulator [Chromatiales bacterium]
RRAQLVYASSGVMTVTTASAAYLVPPQRAVWMPGGVGHRIDARSAVAMRTLYVEQEELASLPTEVRVLHVVPLLRELIVTAVASGPSYEPGSPEARVMSVILDQISVQPVVALALPMPSDPRLLRVAHALIQNPADLRDLHKWAQAVGASARTLSRLFTAQTGMPFRTWRQQLRLLRALELLAGGDNVTTVASGLGYDNTSAFIAMFRRCLGTTPTRYLDYGKT